MFPVLRYSPYNKAVTEVVRSGTLGELVNAVHVEPVGYYHFAHSYVRGTQTLELYRRNGKVRTLCRELAQAIRNLVYPYDEMLPVSFTWRPGIV
jgi:hypothetical protein